MWRKDGGVGGGFGHVGEAGACYSTMARVVLRAGEVRDNVDADSINVEKYRCARNRRRARPYDSPNSEIEWGPYWIS